LADIPPSLAAQSQRAMQREMMPSRYRYATHAGTVGAGLAPPSSADDEPSKPLETFAAGDHVRHPKFGEGIVVSCEPSGPDYQIVIAFRARPGSKLLPFAPLERAHALPLGRQPVPGPHRQPKLQDLDMGESRQ
jgi:hypothetical protein